MNSSSANSSCIWIGALPHITLEHIELGNCLSTRTLDTIWINPPEEGRRYRGSKAGIRKKSGKEWQTLWSVFTPILKEKKVHCLVFFCVSPCLLKQRGLPPATSVSLLECHWFSLQLQNTDVKQYRNRALEWIRVQFNIPLQRSEHLIVLHRFRCSSECFYMHFTI